MTTARDLIKSALRKIHVLGVGSSLSAEEAADGLEALNSMLSSFSAEGAIVFQETTESFTLVSGQASYTIGSGLDFNTTAPLEIKAACIRQGSTDYPVSPYDEREYSRIAEKNITGSVPDIYYYDNNYPTANIYLYPVPSGADTFTWFARKPLTSFSTLDTEFAMPGQFEAMITMNLAEWLASEYEREPSNTLRKLAMQTKKAVIAQNRRNEKNTSDLSGIPSGDNSSSIGNIYSGYYT